MADWGQRAKDKDRDDAIKVIEAAAARGQIIDADKDKRIQEVRAAGTVGEIELITRGLAAASAVPAGVSSDPPPVSDPAPPVAPTFPQYQPPNTPPVAEPGPMSSAPLPPSTVQYGEPLTSSGGTPYTPPSPKRSGAGGKLALILVLCVVAGIAVPVFFGIRALVDSVDDLPSISGGGADVFSDSEFDKMVDKIESETGTTQVWEFSMYRDYAVVYVPTQASGKRYIAFRYDGRLTEFTKGSRSDDEKRFDLRDVDVSVLRKFRDKARDLVDNPNSNYVIVRAPFIGEGPIQVTAYASNEFSESGWIEGTLDGKITAEHPPS